MVRMFFFEKMVQHLNSWGGEDEGIGSAGKSAIGWK